MNNCVEKISEKYHCRQELIKELYKTLNENEDYPEAIYLHGISGTGKSAILKEFLTQINCKYVFINCIECYSYNILFETILNELFDHKLCAANNYNPYVKCANMKSFLKEILKLDKEDSYVIVLEQAEKLRDMEYNILPIFLRLQEMTNLNICCVLVGMVCWEKFLPKTGLTDVITIHVPQYTDKELFDILIEDFGSVKEIIQNEIFEDEKKIEILKSLDLEFYNKYLTILLHIFFPVCRDLNELKKIARDCFIKYCEPVLNGTCSKTNSKIIWENIKDTLVATLNSVYVRINEPAYIKNNTTVQRLELPYYAKFLLIASFLASYNGVKEDKRLFMKHHGKKRKRVQDIHKAKVSEKMNLQIGPKSFTVNRLLAIFYAIIEEKLDWNVNLLTQVISSVSLKLFRKKINFLTDPKFSSFASPSFRFW